MVEDRPIMSIKYCLPVPVFYFWRKLSRTLQRGLSVIAEHLVFLLHSVRIVLIELRVRIPCVLLFFLRFFKFFFKVFCKLRLGLVLGLRLVLQLELKLRLGLSLVLDFAFAELHPNAVYRCNSANCTYHCA